MTGKEPVVKDKLEALEAHDTSCIVCERDLADCISGERTSRAYISCTECGRVCCSEHEGINWDDLHCPVCSASHAILKTEHGRLSRKEIQ
jgi:hypothetical protein